MKTNWIPIAAVIAVGAILAVLILAQDKHQPTEAEAGSAQTQSAASDAPEKGPQGGKIFTQGGFSVEVTIFEEGVPPQFRLYLYADGKPIPPSSADVTLVLSRLGRQPQIFKFVPEADYLLGNHVVEEPHSFDVAINARHNGTNYRWRYSQVEARVEMPDAVLKSSGVEILTAGEAVIRPTIKLPGEIAFNGDRIVHVVPRVGGIVVAVPRDLGQSVRQGEVLAVIESQALADLRSELRAARKRLALARVTFEREKKLWQEKITAQQDYLSAQQALSEAEIAAELAAARLRALGAAPGASGNLTRFEVRAPISGVIVAKAVARGQTVKEDADLFTLADLSTVWAQISVYPKDLGVIKVGQRADVKATAFAARATGTLSYIGALIGEQTRTAQARVTLPNPSGAWRPGMFVDVELAAAEVRVPVAVAADAIQTVRDWTVVFGRYGNYFEARPLELGRSDGRMVEVVAGLKAGERYAGGNSFAIKAELGKSGASHDH